MKKTTILLAGALVLTCLGGAAACTPHSDYKLGGIPLDSYTVVYEAENAAAEGIAKEFCEAMENFDGTSLKCVPDTEADSGREFLIGSTNRTKTKPTEGMYTIAAEGDSVEIVSDDPSGIVCGVQKALTDIKLKQADYATPVTKEYGERGIKVMSFNVRTADVIAERIARVKNVIARNDPDLLGTQEVCSDWQPTFRNLEGYTCVGTGRDINGGGEANFILFKTDKFNLIEEGTRWYTDTPDTPSVLEGSSYRRIYTYALLERKSDNLRFLYVNTHMHLHKASRVKAADYLTDFLEENYSEYPVYITGDFNATYTDDPAREDYDTKLVAKGFLNARLAAKKSDDHITYPTDLYASDDQSKGSIIDYCMIRESELAATIVSSYYVDAAEPENVHAAPGLGNAASDHYPIVTETLLYERF